MKKRSRISKIRKGIRQQLSHLQRSLACIDALLACGVSLLATGRPWCHKLLVVSELVRQQNVLDHSESRSVPDRIVSLHPSRISPIVRGKARSNVESGARISMSDTCDGNAFPDWLSYDPCNEAEDRKGQAAACRYYRYGRYSKVVFADPIDRTRANQAYCQRHGIHLSGPRLPRPRSDPHCLAEETKQFLDHKRHRNAVEATIGQGTRRYGWNLISEKLATTWASAIALNVLVMNLDRLLQLLLARRAGCNSHVTVLNDQPAAA